MNFLVHEATKSLVLNATDPFALRDALSNSRVLHHPDYNFSVQHTLEATKVLRNMGYAAPAPIRYQYGWPGKFRPFDHQVVMSEFLTLHRRAFNLSEMGCVDATTEYLTPTGWKRIDQYAGGQVMQYDPTTQQGSFVEPQRYIKAPCADMIRVKTKYGLDQLLSDEHKVMVTEYRNQARWSVKAAADMLAWHDDYIAGQGQGWSKATLPVTFRYAGGSGVSLTDAQLRLQIAVIADGHFPSQTTPRCTVRVKKLRKKLRLRELLAAAGVTYEETQPEYSSALGFSVFKFSAPLRLKVFDDRFWSATRNQLLVVTDEVMHWGGHIGAEKGSDQFSSYTKESADFVQFAYAATQRVAKLNTYTHKDHKGVEHIVTARGSGQPLMVCSRSSSGVRREVMWREPSPDGFKYCFEVPTGFLVLRRNGCVFVTGNSAKTNASLWAADWLMRTGRVKKCLVLSPLSTLERVWANDIFDTLMHRKCVVVHGSLEKRKTLLKADVDFYILNHDGLAIKEIERTIAMRPDIDLIIVDEAGMFRNYQTNKYKALARITARPETRLWLMTGTPCPNAPTDAWALARLVAPDRVPKYFGGFKRATMMQISQFKWVPRPDAFTTAYDAMQPAVRFKKIDCLDLPPVTTQDHSCALTKEQGQAFRDLQTTMAAEARTGVKITAVNAADKIGKLRQILCGAVKDTATGEYIIMPHAPRTTALLDAIESASAKVIVVCPFKGIIAPLEKEIAAHHSVAVLNGDVSPRARDNIIRDFKSQADPRILLCHPKVMAHGLNLTEADTLIFYAPIYSNDEVQQVNERFNRAGQTRKMTIIRIGAHPLEWAIYKQVDDKKDAQNGILDLYKAVTE